LIFFLGFLFIRLGFLFRLFLLLFILLLFLLLTLKFSALPAFIVFLIYHSSLWKNAQRRIVDLSIVYTIDSVLLHVMGHTDGYVSLCFPTSTIFSFEVYDVDPAITFAIPLRPEAGARRSGRV